MLYCEYHADDERLDALMEKLVRKVPDVESDSDNEERIDGLGRLFVLDCL